MTMHKLKVLPKYYADIVRGAKRFELRKDDRGFKIGDILELHEFNPDLVRSKTAEKILVMREPNALVLDTSRCYTGRIARVRVTYKIDGPCFGLEAGHCIMSFKMLAHGHGRRDDDVN